MSTIVDFRRVADEAAARATTAPDPKQPLFRPLPPPEAFPLAALGALGFKLNQAIGIGCVFLI